MRIWKKLREFTRGSQPWVEQSTIRGMSNGAAPWEWDYRRAVQHCNGWVYRCAYGNAQAAASVPLRLFVRKPGGKKGIAWANREVKSSRKKRLMGDMGHTPDVGVMRKAAQFDGEFVEVTEHPLLDVLRGGNPFFDGFQLDVMRFVSQELTGNYYMYVSKDNNGVPVEIAPMLPQYVEILADQDGSGSWIDGYRYRLDGSSYTDFSVEETIHFRSPSVKNLYYGYGKLQACWDSLGLLHSERVVNKSLFDNNMRPDWHMHMSGAGEESIKNAREKIGDLYRGVRKQGLPMITGGPGDIKMTPLNFNPKDVSSTDGLIEEIAAVFGYPMTKLLANDPNRANAAQGDLTHMRDTILPMLRIDEQTLNQTLLPMFPDLEGNAFLCYDDPVPTDRVQDDAIADAQVASGRKTINEDRADRGEEPVEGGDIPRVNGVPLDQLGQQADPLAGMFQLSAQQGETKAAELPDIPAIINASKDGSSELLAQAVRAQVSDEVQKMEQANALRIAQAVSDLAAGADDGE